jgi:hypothetical protein
VEGSSTVEVVTWTTCEVAGLVASCAVLAWVLLAGALAWVPALLTVAAFVACVLLGSDRLRAGARPAAGPGSVNRGFLAACACMAAEGVCLAADGGAREERTEGAPAREAPSAEADVEGEELAA